MEEIRKYHNLVKRHLIQSVSKPGLNALDVGCGCGGDLQKWQHCQVNVDMCDPNIESITEAKNRASKLKMNVNFFDGDILMCPKKIYKIICYNFSLHYIFQSKDLFLKSIKAIKTRMKTGSILIGCIPDSENILMSTPFKDEFGNIMVRGENTGLGKFNEKLFVHLEDTPYYKDGLKVEPIAYKDLLVTHLEDMGIDLVLWEPLENFKISKLYSRFIFVCK